MPLKIQQFLDPLLDGQSLIMEEAASVMEEIMEGETTPVQLSAFLVALRAKGETAEEIAGMASVMRAKAVQVSVEGDVVDTAGTGGDGKGSFNVSTAAALVAAGAGLKVAKHGNRAVTGSCGSADVLEALGVKIDLGPDGVKRGIEEVGFGFMFAPNYHPAMRHAMPVRRELRVRTVFNLLGPLTNPAGAKRQLLGVADPHMCETMSQALGLLGAEHSMVVHGEDGLDELTLGGMTHVWETEGGVTQKYVLWPEDCAMMPCSLDEIKGGTPEESARMMRETLQGERGPLRDLVVFNSAAVMQVGGLAPDFIEGRGRALGAIDSGAALRTLDNLAALSQSLA